MKKMLIPSLYGISVLLFGISFGLTYNGYNHSKVISEKYKSISIAQDFECVSSLDLKGVKPKEKIE
ncbi:hypothetical protein [Proteus mirabilis]|uniref:hypothetical protein n=1 Tax=Proteus mirabilis TaxID=584 RepID=UPI000DDA3AA1|nr:hypothetical protein [Proteus mirabilis]EMA4642811.1 hypothetical protein [Proteus mirabilis]MBL1397048.1 hypothetical protein [Proteus mirabilis]MBQ0656114.1 hypothetical protein [Proteus mirabilis]MDL2104965.1 hypothetical protein [Proteus mirabilis]WVJ28456.1 hypothetical protein V1228_18545 [Proteus mirabilis]